MATLPQLTFHIETAPSDSREISPLSLPRVARCQDIGPLFDEASYIQNPTIVGQQFQNIPQASYPRRLESAKKVSKHVETTPATKKTRRGSFLQSCWIAMSHSEEKPSETCLATVWHGVALCWSLGPCGYPRAI